MNFTSALCQVLLTSIEYRRVEDVVHMFNCCICCMRNQLVKVSKIMILVINDW